MAKRTLHFWYSQNGNSGAPSKPSILAEKETFNGLPLEILTKMEQLGGRIKESPMNKVFTYCRVSTTDQNLEAQKEELLKAHPDAELHCEKASATSLEKRPVLQAVLNAVRGGDKLVVWKIDRLVRNMRDLSEIVALLKERGASLEIVDQKIDTSTPSGTAFLQMLGVFAEFETNIRAERQAIGIAKR